MIEAAEAGRAYAFPFSQEPESAVGFDTGDIEFERLIFADGVTDDDSPRSVVTTLASGAIDVCAFWDYSGMADGMSWEALWFVDGELNEGGSIVDATWLGGESGYWWVCIFDDSGLVDGFYEVTISVAGEVVTGDGVFVGGDHPTVEFELNVRSALPACFVFLSPSQALNWGQDELGATEVLEPGSLRTFAIPAGIYDLLVLDCDNQTLASEFEMDLTKGGVRTVVGLEPGIPAISYELIADDSAVLEVMVPVEWGDRSGAAWQVEGEVIGAALSASPDRQAYADGVS